MEGLGDVAQVGHQPLATDRAEHAGGQAPLLGRLEERRDPRPRSSSAQPRSRSAISSVSTSPPASSSLRVRPRNDVSAAARTRPDRCGCSSASSRVSHSSPAGEVEQLRAAADHRRDAALGERRPDQLRLRPLTDEDGDMASRDGLAVPGRVGGEQGGDVARAVGRDVAARI